MSAIIVRLRKQGSEPETLRFDKEEIYIGRLDQNDVTLSMTNVSKKHAVVWVDGPTIYVSDAGSTNGTYVNKRRVTQPTPISPTDEVYVGDFVFTVQFEAVETPRHDSSSPYSYGKSGRPAMPPPPRSSSTTGSDGSGYRAIGNVAGNAVQVGPPAMRVDSEPKTHGDSLSDIYLDDSNDGNHFGEGDPDYEPVRRLQQDTIGSSDGPIDVGAQTMAPLAYKDVPRSGYAPVPPVDINKSYDVRDTARSDYVASPNDTTNLGSASQLSKSRLSGGHHAVEKPENRRRNGHSSFTGTPPGRQGLEGHGPRETPPREKKGARTSILGNDSKGKNADIFKFPSDISDLPDRVKFTERETLFSSFIASLEADGINPMQVSPLSEDLLAPYLNRIETDEETRKAFADELLRMGPINNLLKDEDVTEIFVNRYDQIVVKRGAESSYAEWTFHSPDSLKLTARRLVHFDTNGKESATGTYVDIRFMESAIATVSIPSDGESEAFIVIQRKQLEDDSLDGLVEGEMLSKSMATFLTRAMATGLNILIAGPLGCEKLRLLSSLSALLPSSIRLVYLSRGHQIKTPSTSVTLKETDQGNFDIETMMTTAVSLRPDRIFLEQIKGVEAYSWVTSVATAVEGCVSSISASSTQDALGNLLTLSMLASHVPSPYAIKEQIARSLDLIVVLNNVGGQSRVVTISEVNGVDIGSFRINDIYRFKMDDSFNGHYEATGYIPQAYESLRQSGVDVDISIFRE